MRATCIGAADIAEGHKGGAKQTSARSRYCEDTGVAGETDACRRAGEAVGDKAVAWIAYRCARIVKKRAIVDEGKAGSGTRASCAACQEIHARLAELGYWRYYFDGKGVILASGAVGDVDAVEAAIHSGITRHAFIGYGGIVGAEIGLVTQLTRFGVVVALGAVGHHRPAGVAYGPNVHIFEASIAGNTHGSIGADGAVGNRRTARYATSVDWVSEVYPVVCRYALNACGFSCTITA
jgi:hypothetical protein